MKRFLLSITFLITCLMSYAQQSYSQKYNELLQRTECYD